MFKIGVFAIIFNDKKEVLLCHRRDCNIWNLPGGGLEEKESPWEGVIREVREETGFEAKIEGLIGIYNKPQKNEIVFCFLCSIVGGGGVLNDEANEIVFFSYSNLPENISQKHKERIRDAFASSNKIILKSQDSPDHFDLKKPLV